MLAAVTLGFALLLAGALHPTRGVLKALLRSRPVGLTSRTRWLWYPLAVAVPLALAGLTLAGFQYTATTLFQLWINQLWLVLGLVVLQQAIVRWLLVIRRALTLRTALARRARLAALSELGTEVGDEGVGEGGGNGGAAAAKNETALDLMALDGQTRSLVSALMTIGTGLALWMLWSDVLPALGVLERIPLWHSTRLVEGESRLLPVTLADLGIVLIIATGAIVAVRYLPALLEILMLKHTGVSAGARYTLITSSRLCFRCWSTGRPLSARAGNDARRRAVRRLIYLWLGRAGCLCVLFRHRPYFWPDSPTSPPKPCLAP